MKLDIPHLGVCQYQSPLALNEIKGDQIVDFVSEDERILVAIDKQTIDQYLSQGISIPAFEKAGPRKKLFFKPGKTVSAIVSCGGLCPGINAVIRSIVNMNLYQYHNQRVYGIRYGFEGLNPDFQLDPLMLTSECVDTIQSQGGTILGTSRGPQDTVKMVDQLVALGVDILYTIGGDGTQKAALSLIEEIQKRKLPIAIVGIPKTIDNDLNFIDKTFGMETAFSKASEVIQAAHIEAKAARNGIGIVKLMGRESGFIAAHATIASNEVNFCLIPEMNFKLNGPNGFFEILKNRILNRGHAVIVIAEGVAAHFMKDPKQISKDASGNLQYEDIGLFFKHEIQTFMADQQIPVTIKYIDPSYLVRSCGPTPNDAIFCAQLGQMAVHAGMSGHTGLVIGYHHGQFTHLPMSLTTQERKHVDLESSLWLSVLESTGQPNLA